MSLASQITLLATRVGQEFKTVRSELSTAKVTILASGDPIPVGQPANTVIVRKA